MLPTQVTAMIELLSIEPYISLFWIFLYSYDQDCILTSIQAKWVRKLQKEHPCCAFRASVTNPFGKGSLIALLRQFSSLHKDRKQISVGIIGFPNIGKSSIINTLRGKKTCVTAPIPGSTLVWQYVTLMKRIYLIDSPGIVPPDQNASAEDILLRGSVRTEKVENPAQYIPAVMSRVKQHHMERTYSLKGWKDSHHFLELLARKMGRLLKAGEPDVDAVARIVINDFLRGRLPWYTAPPVVEGPEDEIEGRSGRLGEMPKKRKRDDESMPDTSMGAPTPQRSEDEEESGEEDEDFEGFGSDNESAEKAEKPSKKKKKVEADDEVDVDDIISLGASSESEAGSDGEEEDESEDEAAEEEEVPVSKNLRKRRK